MRVLLINPEAPESYWSGSRALSFTRRRCLLPPLGLITVAAMLPPDWTCRLADLQVRPLDEADLAWADLALLTGMKVQAPALRRALERCRAAGVTTVVGGPYVSSSPEELAAADHLVLGEAEEVLPEVIADLRAGRARRIYRESAKPGLEISPVPRYDLLERGAYHQMALQFSRGCPYSCEFCDVVVLFGRRPRTKTPDQVIAELEAIRATGFTGDVFFVDDNFIGNRPAVLPVLRRLADWRRSTRAPLEFYTEASINLAEDAELTDLMTDAGFTAVFVGIETPSEEALRETGKLQNLRRGLEEQVHRLLARGLDVWGGFILGFDSDGPEIFDRMIRFVQQAAIPYAMVGLLNAPPHTPLYRRLEQAGRLRDNFTGDQFGLTNVVTHLPVGQLLAGYRRVLESLYGPEAFFQRCRENLARWRPIHGARRPLVLADLRAAWRAVRAQGVTGPYRRAYWRFLRWVLLHHPGKMRRALALAAAGHHYILYTREVVAPALGLEASRAGTS